MDIFVICIILSDPRIIYYKKRWVLKCIPKTLFRSKILLYFRFDIRYLRKKKDENSVGVEMVCPEISVYILYGTCISFCLLL